MLVCSCSLAGTKACLSCSQYIKYYGETSYLQIGKPFDFQRAQKITEKYDKDGNLIERIIES